MEFENNNLGSIMKIAQELIYHNTPHQKILDEMMELSIAQEEKVLELASDGIKKFPAFEFKFWSHTALFYSNEDLFSKALIFLDKAIKTLPLHTQSDCEELSNLLFEKYSLLNSLNLFKEALNALNDSILISVPIYKLRLRAELHFKLNDFDAALFTANALIIITDATLGSNYSSLVDIYMLRKKINIALGNVEEAKKDHESAVEYDYKNIDYLINRKFN